MRDENEPGDAPEEEYEAGEAGANKRRDSILAGLVRKAISQGVGAISDDKAREAIVNEVLRRARQTSTMVVDTTEDSVRRLVGELSLPKDVVERLIHRLDDYKADILGIFKEELHDFLDRIDLGHELQKALTSLSLEVSTEIRFVPNEKGVTRSGVKAEMKSRTRVKRANRRKRRDKGPEDAPEEAE